MSKSSFVPGESDEVYCKFLLSMTDPEPSKRPSIDAVLGYFGDL